MRLLIAILLVVTAFGCKEAAHEEKPKYRDLILFNLKGDVETISDSLFVIDSTGDILPDSVCFETGKYISGGLQQYISKDSTGKNISHAYYYHDSASLLNATSVYTNGKLVDSFVLLKDSAGQYMALDIGPDQKIEAIYTSLKRTEYGALAAGNMYTADMKLTGSFTNNFVGALLHGSTDLDSSGKEVTRKEYKLDEHGNTMEAKTFTRKDSSIKISTYKYEGWDTAGNWTTSTEFDGNGKPVKIIKRSFVYASKKE